MSPVRKAAVAGSWYPGSAPSLAAAVDGYLERAPQALEGELVALIAPHAGLMYSGPVAAHAYRLLRDRAYDVAVLVGPSHFVAFDGVAAVATGGFQTPFGVARIDEGCAAALLRASPLIVDDPSAHTREHSLEMQLPFVQRLLPDVPIVPLLIGLQTEDTSSSLASAIAAVLHGRRALLIASSDLSHYHDARTASTLDRIVIECVAQFDEDALQRALNARPEHACGGGPIVAVMRAARRLGAHDARVLRYADSGDVSGDKTAVVGYMAAALGNFDAPIRCG